VLVRGVRLVDVHHHGPLEVRHGAGYCVQTLEPSHVAGQWSPSAELSGVAWCHLHPHVFMENLLTVIRPVDDTLRWPMGDKRVG
jgi:hypothetical protein